MTCNNVINVPLSFFLSYPKIQLFLFSSPLTSFSGSLTPQGSKDDTDSSQLNQSFMTSVSWERRYLFRRPYQYLKHSSCSVFPPIPKSSASSGFGHSNRPAWSLCPLPDKRILTDSFTKYRLSTSREEKMLGRKGNKEVYNISNHFLLLIIFFRVLRLRKLFRNIQSPRSL